MPFTASVNFFCEVDQKTHDEVVTGMESYSIVEFVAAAMSVVQSKGG